MSLLKKVNFIFFIFISFFSLTCLGKQDNIIYIRVLLCEKNSKEETVFTIGTDCELLIMSPHTTQKLLIKEKQLKIVVKNNNIYLPIKSNNSNKKELKKVKSNEIKLAPINSNLVLNDIEYQGKLTLKIDIKQNKLLFINTLDLNDYLYSVLVSESYQSWPMEMQKVQAIVSRSYALYCAKQSQKKNKSYDLKRNNFHQTYNGLHNHIHLRQAIEETKNIILTYKDEIALAMFDACCGGIIPANMKSLNFAKAPYLARKTPCTFCKNYKFYQWHKEISKEEFLKNLKLNPNTKKKFNQVGRLTEIQTKKDKAGIIHTIKLICTRKNIILSGLEFWENMRENVKSLNFKIEKNKNKIIIDGKGFGHQIGLCQRGARELVRQGWDFRKILKYYYPETNFSRLKNA